MLAGLIFLFAPQNLTTKFQLAFAYVFRWPLSIGRGFRLSAYTRQPLTDAVTRREYNQLQNYLLNVTEELNQERQKVKKLSGLRKDRRPLEGAKLVFADVISGSIDDLHGEFIINRGDSDGLNKGQFVLGDNSIIGTVSDVSARTARVKLITDPASKIAVRIAELDVSRMMQGAGGNLAGVQLIRHKPKTGDFVYADKKPGFLDVPMVAGKVAGCKRNDENPLLWDITVSPACELNRLSDVAVVIMNPQQ
jgi:rod shape-determining protein MreC